jgi:hypothetical protein
MSGLRITVYVLHTWDWVEHTYQTVGEILGIFGTYEDAVAAAGPGARVGNWRDDKFGIVEGILGELIKK